MITPDAHLVISDGDLVLLPGGLVAGRHVQNTVGIDVESDLNEECMD